MKSLAYAVVTASLFAVPLASFAQSTQPTNEPLTRAEVKAQLEQLEQAGYNPSASNDANYPEEIQAAEARVAAQNANQGYGPGTNGSTQSGQQAAPAMAPANSGQ
jgi:hypothetical protein